MAVEFRDCKVPLSEKALSKVEKRLKIKLPEEYRRFLLAHNGGRLTPSVFKFKGQSGAYADSCVDWFLAVYDGEYNNFETYFERYKVERVRLPVELVPIAHDPGGNLICISLADFDRGSIYFWDHEHEHESTGKSVSSHTNVHLIADSIDEFLGSLYLLT